MMEETGARHAGSHDFTPAVNHTWRHEGLTTSLDKKKKILELKNKSFKLLFGQREDIQRQWVHVCPEHQAHASTALSPDAGADTPLTLRNHLIRPPHIRLRSTVVIVHSWDRTNQNSPLTEALTRQHIPVKWWWWWRWWWSLLQLWFTHPAVSGLCVYTDN